MLSALSLLLLYLVSARQPVAACLGSTMEYPLIQLTPAQGLGSVKIGIYNIHRGIGIDGKKDIDRITEVIKDIDIVGLCEVEGPLFGFISSQAHQIGHRKNQGALFSSSYRRWLRFDPGNGLVCKYPVKRWQQDFIADSTGTKNKSLLSTEILVDNTPVRILTTQLSRCIDHGLQMQLLFDRVMQYKHCILLADLDASRSNTVLRKLLESGGAVDAIGQMLGSDDDPVRTEWILTRGVELAEAGTHGLGPSDHAFYWIRFRIPEINQFFSFEADNSHHKSQLPLLKT
jgi:hypothetical protein